jgi:CDP-glucose 4,6-dehydratase
VYQTQETEGGHLESDPLGGGDPYSASKAMADILAQAWSKTTNGSPIATARAGNVIGGGDFAEDRIITDAIEAFMNEKTLKVRNPNAVRPWQHVLDCLAGYLQIVDRLLVSPISASWNVGPVAESYKTVSDVLALAEKSWGKTLSIEYVEPKYLERNNLTLDTTKIKLELGWENLWNFETSVMRTITWYKGLSNGENPDKLCKQDISAFLSTRTKTN